jgi:hypothetical protein
MEHPTGDFGSAVEAMSDAIARLRRLADWPGPIVVGAQGYGGKPDTYRFMEVRLEKDSLSVDSDHGPLDLDQIRSAAKVGARAIVPHGSEYSIAAATPSDAAAVLDAIFRCHFGLQAFPGEGDDYAVGAEWS